MSRTWTPQAWLAGFFGCLFVLSASSVAQACLLDDDCDNGLYCDGQETCTGGVCQSGTAVVCNDDIACTVDICNEGTDQCDFIPDHTPCQNGFYCDGAERCVVGLGCQPGEAIVCNDGVDCTIDACNEDLDRCDATPDDTVCNDNLWCNGQESCDALLGCVTTDIPQCNDGVDCTLDTCNEALDRCEASPNDTACNDNLWCNGQEWCDPVNDCQQGMVVDCDDGVACTLDHCDEALQQCLNEPEASLCSDDRYCNGEERCDAVQGCLPGEDVDCSDGLSCTVDRCNEAQDTCNHLADDSLCDNDLFCDGVERCDLQNGCEAGETVGCDDGVSCTVDTCDEDQDRCTHTPDNQVCSDGEFCNGEERCDAVLGCRANTEFDCDDGVSCTVDSCNEAQDRCDHSPNDALCDDGNPCTSPDTCDTENDCTHSSLPDATVCDLDPTRPEVCRDGQCTYGCNVDEDCNDGITCTLDTCQGGYCTHETSDALCDDGLFCNGVETCLTGLGCEQGAAPDCSDGLSCTEDHCNEAENRCDNTPNDSLCDNGLWCDGEEICAPGLGCQMGTARNCNDGISCTVDACDELNDRCQHQTQDSRCDDGLFCNGQEWCDPSQGCRDGSVPVCDDGIDCTQDSCDEQAGACAHLAQNTQCNDGSDCTGPDICDTVQGCLNPALADGTTCSVGGGEGGLCLEGVCIVGCLQDSDCDDGIACTQDSCNPSTLQCEYQPQDAPCDDGLWCNGTEGCAVGIGCLVRFPVDCDDGIACTQDSCDEQADQCTHQADNSLCDDAVFCNGEEVCNVQVGCRSGSGVPCDDGVSCTLDSCSEASRSCQHDADDSVCNNGLWCDGEESCHPTEDCQRGDSPNCDDEVSCTQDRCDEINDQCRNTPQDSACSDGNACTGPDVCLPDSGCSTPATQDGNPCPLAGGLGVCRSGLCTSGCTTDNECSDGIACTVDTCDLGSNTCVFTPDDNLCDTNVCGANQVCNPVLGCEDQEPISCDDGVACTTDTCSGNACHHSSDDNACSDGNVCNGIETCDAAAGCLPGEALHCDDGNPCTVDSCDPVEGCLHEARDALCDNGLWCDGQERCDAVLGCQAGTPPDCNDEIVCTEDLCSEAQDRCAHIAHNEPCDNGLWCDGEERCDVLLGCQAGTPVDCSDAFACTVDQCNETDDVCTHSADDSVCDNQIYCDGEEVCTPDAGCIYGEPVLCEDGVSCTDDACDEDNRSCSHTPTDSICDDGLFCNGVETCDAIQDCQAGTPVDCSDAFACTTESCDEYADQCVISVNHSLCDDTVYCNGAERCVAGQGCTEGTTPSCDDGIACTEDECSTAIDACLNYANDTLCSDGLACNGEERCDAANGCLAGTPIICSDTIACTLDVCINDEGGAYHCQYTADNARCSDGQFCNGQEVCDPENGCIAGEAVDCDDHISCTEQGCNEAEDRCEATPFDHLCADDNPCTINETCDPSQDCQAEFLADGTSCGADSICQNGQCVLQCSDAGDCPGHPCLIQVCDSEGGECEQVYGPTCDAQAVCVNQQCQQGCSEDTDCNDDVFCSFESCNTYANICEYTTYDMLCDADPSLPPTTACDGTPRCEAFQPYCVLDTPPDCDDGVFCTQDSCQPTGDSYTCVHQAQNGWCDDGLYCNGLETCVPNDASSDANGCLTSGSDPCDDGVSCTEDQCLEEFDLCFNLATDDLCNDGLYCNGTETCDETLDCQAGEAPSCDDSVPCTVDACNETTDSCTHQPDDASCSDGQFCNGDETCDALAGCQAGTSRNCDDGFDCTTDQCNEATDSCNHQADNTVCNDGQFCNGQEVCDLNLGCTNGSLPNCDDGISCTVDACNEANDRCDHQADSTLCDDGQYCNGTETCDALLDCQAGNPVVCSDSVSCTTDACDEATDSCTFTPDNAACSNGLFCDGVETCDALLGCQPASDPCEDSVSCTVDSCDEANDRCEHQASDQVCDDGRFCNGAEVCDPLNDCQQGSPVQCNDGIPCTEDVCSDELGRCDYQPDNAFCSDNTFCNGQEVCDPSQGGCVADPAWKDCNDNIACTADACLEAEGRCENTPQQNLCDNGLWCDGEESCDAVLGCRTGEAPVCADGIDCTEDWCNEEFDRCEATPRTDLCDDGLRCNGQEVCDPQEGCRAGSTPDCDDGVACTVDRCEESERPSPCVHTADDTLCVADDPCRINGVCDASEDCQYQDAEEGTPCDLLPNLAEICQDGACVSQCSGNDDCNDEIACTVDTCNLESGLCTHEPQHESCDDGVFCNGPEQCQAGLGCVQGDAPNCNDDIACTVDRCSNEDATCLHTPDHGLCADEEPCTENLCQPESSEDESGCFWPNAADGTPCGDGFECQDGTCQESDGDVDGDVDGDEDPDGDDEVDDEQPPEDGDEDQDDELPTEDGDEDQDSTTDDDDDDDTDDDDDLEDGDEGDDDDDDLPPSDGDSEDGEVDLNGGEDLSDPPPTDCSCGQQASWTDVMAFLLLGLGLVFMRRFRNREASIHSFTPTKS